MLTIEKVEVIKKTEVIEARPCPMCGSQEALTWSHSTNSGYISIICNASSAAKLGGCGLEGGYQNTKAECMAYWNKRTY